MVELSDLGEFGLIERLAEILRGPVAGRSPISSDLTLGIGDDAAVWTPAAGTVSVATADALVEGIHFDLRFTSWYDLGWKALAVNVSDAAAMGARPRYALVTLGLPSGGRLSDLENLYRGMAEHCDRFGMRIVGGDVVSSPTFFISVALYAEGGARLLRRDAARAGDVVAVTGTLGDSAAGLRLLQEARANDGEDAAMLVRAHLRPLPRVAEAGALVEQGVGCGMDLSDGLLGDAKRLARASGVRVEFHLASLPLSEPLRRMFGPLAAEIALAGGEDYELLVCAPPDVMARGADAVARLQDTRLTVVGRILASALDAEPVTVTDETGKEFQPRLRSWEHGL